MMEGATIIDNECGCRIYVTEFQNAWVEYCSKHAAADDLLKALRIARDRLNLAIDADDWAFVDSAVWIIEHTIDIATKDKSEEQAAWEDQEQS